MTMHTENHQQREFTGKHMLIIMIAFFGVIMAVNFTMASLASRSWTGLVVKNSYVASQHYNEELQAARSQRQRGWASSIEYANGRMDFVLADRDGNPVVLDQLSVVAERPVAENQDRDAVLIHQGKGLYLANIDLAEGVWNLRIEGNSGDKAFRRDDRIFVNKNGAAVK